LPDRKAVKLKTFRGGGLQPGVDIDCSAALLNLTDSRPNKQRGGTQAC